MTHPLTRPAYREVTIQPDCDTDGGNAVGGDPTVTVFRAVPERLQTARQRLRDSARLAVVKLCRGQLLRRDRHPTRHLNSGHVLATTGASGSPVSHRLSGSPTAIITNVVTNNKDYSSASRRERQPFDVNIATPRTRFLPLRQPASTGSRCYEVN